MGPGDYVVGRSGEIYVIVSPSKATRGAWRVIDPNLHMRNRPMAKPFPYDYVKVEQALTLMRGTPW